MLEDLTIIDLTDERGIYGAKLLSDLGASVIRPEPRDGDPLRKRGPLRETRDPDLASLWYAFFASNRRFFSLSLEDENECQALRRQISRADIILRCDNHFTEPVIDIDTLIKENPKLILIDMSSFGKAGPWKDYLAPDLIAGALGGSAATTGDFDTPPLKGFGELNFMVSGVYLAIAALSALYDRGESGSGQSASISVHEAIASCLEHVFMFYWYADTLDRKEGKVLPRRGALHWSDAYDVMKTKKGSIMITPTPDFDNQLMWLIEEGVQEDLIDPKYLEPENLRLRVDRSMEILRKWALTKEAEPLFFEAQSRHAPYGWVLPLEELMQNPQLRARSWFRKQSIEDQTVECPGAPFRLKRVGEEIKLPLAAHVGPDEHKEQLLKEIGWDAK